MKKIIVIILVLVFLIAYGYLMYEPEYYCFVWNSTG